MEKSKDKEASPNTAEMTLDGDMSYTRALPTKNENEAKKPKPPSQGRRSTLPTGLSSTRSDNKIVLDEHDNHEHTAFAFPTWKKWSILSVIFAVQVSMNFNTSVYPVSKNNPQNLLLSFLETFCFSQRTLKSSNR